MKITSNLQSTAPHLEHLKPQGRGGATGAASAGNEDTASLTSGSEAVSGLQTQLNATPDVRANRVAQLQDALANGTYSVSPAQVAQAMITDLTGRQD